MGVGELFKNYSQRALRSGRLAFYGAFSPAKYYQIIERDTEEKTERVLEQATIAFNAVAGAMNDAMVRAVKEGVAAPDPDGRKFRALVYVDASISRHHPFIKAVIGHYTDAEEKGARWRISENCDDPDGRSAYHMHSHHIETRKCEVVIPVEDCRGDDLVFTGSIGAAYDDDKAARTAMLRPFPEGFELGHSYKGNLEMVAKNLFHDFRFDRLVKYKSYITLYAFIEHAAREARAEARERPAVRRPERTPEALKS